MALNSQWMSLLPKIPWGDCLQTRTIKERRIFLSMISPLRLRTRISLTSKGACSSTCQLLRQSHLIKNKDEQLLFFCYNCFKYGPSVSELQIKEQGSNYYWWGIPRKDDRRSSLFGRESRLLRIDWHGPMRPSTPGLRAALAPRKRKIDFRKVLPWISGHWK